MTFSLKYAMIKYVLIKGLFGSNKLKFGLSRVWRSTTAPYEKSKIHTVRGVIHLIAGNHNIRFNRQLPSGRIDCRNFTNRIFAKIK